MKTKQFLNTITKTIAMCLHAIFFRSDMILKLKENIVLPLKGYFVLNHSSIRLCCYIDNRPQYIHLKSQRAAARFLVRNGFYDFYTEESGQVALYRYHLSYEEHAGVLLPRQEPQQVRWDDISLSTGDVKLLFARKEFKRCMQGQPLTGGAKIIRMGTHREDIISVA